MPVELTEDYFRKGEFGYDNAAADMKAIFMARGPGEYTYTPSDRYLHPTCGQFEIFREESETSGCAPYKSTRGSVV